MQGEEKVSPDSIVHKPRGIGMVSPDSRSRIPAIPGFPIPPDSAIPAIPGFPIPPDSAKGILFAGVEKAVDARCSLEVR